VVRASPIEADTTPVQQAMPQPTMEQDAAAIAPLPATPALRAAAASTAAVVVAATPAAAADVANRRIHC